MTTKIVAFVSLCTFSVVAGRERRHCQWCIMKVAIALLSTIILSSFAHAGTRIETVVSQLNIALQCTNRIWPGLKKDSYRVVFAQPSTNEAWLWTGSSGMFEIVNNTEFPLSSGMPRYSFSKFRGEKVVIINLDEVSEKSRIPSLNVDGAVSLAFHEGFHYLFQMKEPWVAQFTSADRKNGLDRVTAVYLRRMLIRSLKNEFIAGQGFGHSTFWFRKWEALGEAPETKFSDILEGTADYVEVIASIIADRGCKVSEANILQIATANLDFLVGLPMDAVVMKELFSEYVGSGYQIEGYEIGLLSLMAMRSRGVLVGSSEYEMGRDFISEIQTANGNAEKLKIMADLRSAVAKVQTPVEILLRSATPVADQDDQDLINFIRKSAESN